MMKSLSIYSLDQRQASRQFLNSRLVFELILVGGLVVAGLLLLLLLF